MNEVIQVYLAFADGGMSYAEVARHEGESRIEAAESVASAAGASNFDYGVAYHTTS